jgi:AraC-like DNA-binding protein
MTDYERIEKAIYYIKENFQQQPELDDVAAQTRFSARHRDEPSGRPAPWL